MSIGLARGTVRLQDYNPEWSKEFEREVARIQSALPAGPFEHIGSTAIPGMPSKPIIDFMLGVPDLGVVSSFEIPLKALGYIHRANGDTIDRTLFVRGPEECRTHHFSFVLIDSIQWKNAVGFRDMLRTNSELASRYAKLKKELERDFADDRSAYTAAKEPFFREVFSRIVG
jgi:GrpB-like predicted nucleotidyltransferase (UPF0157 family)